MKRSRGIRVGDRVRVVNPEFFVRCGYPMTFAGETRKVLQERSAVIVTFLVQQGVQMDERFQNSRAVEKVSRAVAYELCRQKQWGGKERRIYTQRFETHAGVEFTVQGVRFVKTGTYEPGGDRGTYDGYEYDPPFLSNEKTHRILMTTCYGTLPDQPFAEPLEIEAVNVELIQPAVRKKEKVTA